MPAHCQRSASIEAIRRSSVHRSIATPSSRAAMARARNSILTDPYESLDLLRNVLQEDITKKVGYVMQEFIQDYFSPAVENMKQNLLGQSPQTNSEDPSYSHHWLESVCCDALEHAKLAFKNINTLKVETEQECSKSQIAVFNDNIKTVKEEETEVPLITLRPPKRKHDQVTKTSYGFDSNCSSVATDPVPPTKKKNGKKLNSVGPFGSPSSSTARAAVSSSISNAGDIILVTKQGKPVRREGHKWNPDRLTADETLFILGSRANKALGLGGPGRARLYTKHPELFKYSVKDREDKEWLGKQNGLVPAGSSVGGKACYVMVLQDILELAAADEYSSHPRRKPSELVNAGFPAPTFLVEKMKTLMKQIATDPEDSDEQLLEKATAEMQSIASNEEQLRVQGGITRAQKAIAGECIKAPETPRQNDILIPSNMTENTLPSSDGCVLHTDNSEEKSPNDERHGLMENGRKCEKEGNGDIIRNQSESIALINEIKLEDSEHVSEEHHENDSLVDAGSVEEDDLGSLLHGVNLNSLVREFEMEAACVAAAAAAAEAVEGSCGDVGEDVRGDVCDDDDVAQLGGLLALADDCGQVASNPEDVTNNDENTKFTKSLEQS